MRPDVLKRLSNAGLVLSSYGLVSGGVGEIYRRNFIMVEGDPPAFVCGMMMTAAGVMGLYILNMFALMIRAWLLNEELCESTMTPFWLAGGENS